MSALRTGAKPVVLTCALAALNAVAGCASTGAPNYASQNPAVATRVAQAAAPNEDDGLPAQSPPPGRIRAVPDNPDEPFSKNYGGGNPAALGITAGKPAAEDGSHDGTRDGAHGVVRNAPANAPPIPDDLPPAFRQKLVAAYSQDE